jgi:hypothetical protein
MCYKHTDTFFLGHDIIYAVGYDDRRRRLLCLFLRLNA